ncbi:MAG: TIGR01777 family protein [Sphingobacteriales bacterium]|nr:MAG: TIGR01777 family protein [Sphingobacteriales bacterium]TAF81886.1 MAG: TIGR01777 family protein [Sphingobacteriales bacterium]
MVKRILITGGSGSVGKALSASLLQKGYEVCHLSRSVGKNPDIATFIWNIEAGQIDERCIEGVDTIIHLAGAGIADSRWTAKRKTEIIESRTQSITLIYTLLKHKKNNVKTIISASASGFYSHRGNQLLNENTPPINDFMSNCCQLWEQAVNKGSELGLRVVKFRTGVVLDKHSGALQKIAQPIKLGLGASLGSGKQWISWIAMNDVVNMYEFALQNQQLEGVFNMATPMPVTNLQLTNAIAQQLQKPLWMPNVPALALKLLLGEMSLVVLGSTKMDVSKIQHAGFTFAFAELKNALKNIYG